jgi:uncharacterized membrane protein
MEKNYKQIVVAVISLLVLDILFLYYYLVDKYKIMINMIQGNKLKTNLKYAFCTYSLMVILMVNVIIKYNLTYLDTFIFGFCINGVYDLTCSALLKDWNINLAIIDMIWGGTVYTLALYISKELI